MRWIPERACASLVLMCVACASDDVADSCTHDAVFAGRLPAAPDSAVYEELWRVGGGDAYVSLPLPLAVSRDGRSAIADFELGEVFVVEANGTWRGAVARRGMGPGELSSPVAAVWADDGSLYVYDLPKPAIIRFAADLSWIGERRVDSEAAAAIYSAGSLDWAGVQPSGATALLPGVSPTGGAAALETALRIDDAGRTDTLRTGSVAMITEGVWQGTRLPGYPRLSAAIGAGGRLALIGGDAGWLVDIHEDDGSLALRLCAAAHAQPLTAAERGRVPDERFSDLGAAFADAAPPADPARHGRIVLGADGTIWVQRERRQPYPVHTNLFGDPGTTFDVFSPDGDHVRTLRLPGAARLQGALGDTIWAYELSALDVVTLVAYRVSVR